jgi:hypothetical protein
MGNVLAPSRIESVVMGCELAGAQSCLGHPGFAWVVSQAVSVPAYVGEYAFVAFHTFCEIKSFADFLSTTGVGNPS